MAEQPAGLSPRAAIAMLTLKLRAAEQEALQAEADEKALDHDTMRSELRERLDAMIAERRTYHATAYANAEAKMKADVEAARSAAAAVADVTVPGPTTRVTPAAAAPIIDPIRLIGDPFDIDPVHPPSATSGDLPGSPVIDPATSAPATQQPTAGGQAAPSPTVGTPSDSSAAAVTAPAPASASIVVTGSSVSNGAQPVSIVLDAEVLGKVFAKVFAAMLDERFEAWGRAAIATPPAPAALPPARQRGNVLRHLRQPDVLLLGIASAIVIGVLISWFT